MTRYSVTTRTFRVSHSDPGTSTIIMDASDFSITQAGVLNLYDNQGRTTAAYGRDAWVEIKRLAD